MNRSITLSTKGLLVAVVAALALVVAYLLGNAGGSAQAASGDPATDASSVSSRTLVMTGTGKSVGVPDELTFTVSVGLTRPDLQTALSDANATTSKVLAALAKQGVQRQDVQTTGLSMYPVYDYHSYGPPTLRGYHVSQRAQVLVQDLARGGRAVSAAVAAGGNDVRVGGIGLRIADQEKLLAQARKAAVAEATAKAREYAAAAGQTLGQVTALREVHASPTVVQHLRPYARAAMDAVKGAVPIRAGRDTLAVTVRIVWSLA